MSQDWRYAPVPIDRDNEPVRSFCALTRGLHELADWLAACGIQTVAMEATGVYWVPLHDILEERGLRVCLVNAHDVRNVPGRKSDVLDCQWLHQLHSYGLLRASVRPSADFVALRTYLRHRESLLRTLRTKLTISATTIHQGDNGPAHREADPTPVSDDAGRS